jgi:hypothetical protein
MPDVPFHDVRLRRLRTGGLRSNLARKRSW